MNEEKIVQGKLKKQYDKEFSRQRRKRWKQAAQRLGFKSYGALLDHVVEMIEKENNGVVLETL